MSCRTPRPWTLPMHLLIHLPRTCDAWNNLRRASIYCWYMSSLCMHGVRFFCRSIKKFPLVVYIETTYDLALVNVILFDKREPQEDSCLRPPVLDPLSLRPTMTDSRSTFRGMELVSKSPYSWFFLSWPSFLVSEVWSESNNLANASICRILAGRSVSWDHSSNFASCGKSVSIALSLGSMDGSRTLGCCLLWKRGK